MYFLTQVLVPFGAVLAMNLLENLIESLPWQKRLGRIGWDTCVLSLGVTAAVFSTLDIEPAIGFSIFLLGFLCAILIAYLRRGEEVPGWKAWLSLGLGGAAVAAPSYFVLVR